MVINSNYGILLTTKKKQITNMWSTLVGTQGNYEEWKKASLNLLDALSFA